jgi:hypothetical protein
MKSRSFLTRGMVAKGYAHPEVVDAYERARCLAAETGSGSTNLTSLYFAGGALNNPADVSSF